MAGGLVKDPIDARCKQLINGYRCAKLDAKARDEVCEPAKVVYNAYNLFMGGDLNSYCELNNPDDICAQDACKIEGQFSLDFLVDFISGNIQNMADDSLKSGNFDRESECEANGSNGASNDKQCCGVQPNRAPFSASKGMHGCCGSNLYSVNLQECCQNNIVSSLGSCP